MTEANDQSVTCRRCGAVYALVPAWLPACPHCGASPVPLWRRLRDNRVAATLALAAMAVLAIAYVQPFMSMTAMGQINVYSLLGGIAVLWRGGHPMLAAVIFAFSVVFPVVKLAMLLISTSAMLNLSQTRRDALHRFAVVTGKYSLLDVVVVAIMIVVVKIGDVVTVHAEVGTYLFCLGVLLSMAAGLCVHFPRRESADPTPAQETPHE